MRRGASCTSWLLELHLDTGAPFFIRVTCSTSKQESIHQRPGVNVLLFTRILNLSFLLATTFRRTVRLIFTTVGSQWKACAVTCPGVIIPPTWVIPSQLFRDQTSQGIGFYTNLAMGRFQLFGLRKICHKKSMFLVEEFRLWLRCCFIVRFPFEIVRFWKLFVPPLFVGHSAWHGLILHCSFSNWRDETPAPYTYYSACPRDHILAKV